MLKNKVNSNKHNKNSTFSTFRNSVNNSKIFNSPKVSPIKNKKEKVMITNNNLNEKDILRKIEEYKNEQYKSFNQAIEEEKKKENERIRKYEEENDFEKKQQLEKEMANERAKGNQNILDFQKNINENIKNYEEELRKK